MIAPPNSANPGVAPQAARFVFYSCSIFLERNLRALIVPTMITVISLLVMHPIVDSPRSMQSGDGGARQLAGLATLLVLLTCALAFSLSTAEPDLWGHVQFGRDALTHGLPATTTYAFTAEGHRWINHENLSEIIFAWTVDHLGVSWLLVGKCLMGLGVVALAGLAARSRGVSGATIAFSALLVSANLAAFWQPRPQVFSFVLFAAMMWLLSASFGAWQGRWMLPWGRHFARMTEAPVTALDQRRWCWILALPLLFAVWANTHGAFVAGLAICGAYVGLRSFEALLTRGLRSAGTVSWLAMITVLSGAATLLNPYGVELHKWLLESLTIPRPEIVEWHPLSWQSENLLPFLLLCVATLVGLTCSRRPLDATQLMLLALTAWQAASHQRHVPFFVIMVGFWLPTHWQSAWQRLRSGTAGVMHRQLNLRMLRIQTAGFVAATLLLSVILGLRFRRVEVPKSTYPVSALQFMSDYDLHGRLVVTYNWAQYAIAALGTRGTAESGTTVAFDGRFRTCYPLAVVDQHFDFILGNHPRMPRYRSPDSPPVDPAAVLKTGGPELVLISRRQPHSVRVMQQHRDQWTLLYQDQLAQLWGRADLFDDPHRSTYFHPGLRFITDARQSCRVRWPALPARPPEDTEFLVTTGRTSTPGLRAD